MSVTNRRPVTTRELAEQRDGALVTEPREPGDTHRPRRELPTAPYLEAIVSYGFRGSVRFHVPGHKGGPGADPGPALGDRRARAGARHLPGHRGHRHRPLAHALRAGRGAGRRRLRRRPDVVSHQRRHPGQPRPVPGAGQARPATCSSSATRTPASSTGWCSAAAWPASSRPSTTTSSGMAHGVTPEALEQALDALAGHQRGVHRLARPTTGWPPTSRGCAEVAHAAGVALVVDCAWGSHFGFHPTLPESPLRSAPTRCWPRRTRSSAA